MSRIDSERARARRDRALWVAWSLLVAATIAAATWMLHVLLDLPDPLLPWAASGVLATPVVAAAMFSARLRRHATTVFGSTVVVGGLVLMVLTVYVVIVVGLGDDVDGSEHGVLGLSMIAGLVSVLLANPVRARLRDLVRGWSGPRRRPARTVLETFGTRMTRAVPMDELLLQLTETLRSTIGPLGAEVWTGSDGVLERTVSVPERPRTRITLGAAELAAVSAARVSGNAWAEVWLPQVLNRDEGAGQRPDGQRHAERSPDGSGQGGHRSAIRIAPITHLGKLLGLLVVARPPGEAGFSDDDDRVLTELARQVGLALHNVSLDTALQASLDELKERNAELQASRARIVAAADASRREIERNLHDGAQQHLVAMAVKVGLLARLAGDDPSTVPPMLDELREEIQVTVTELRELAHGIYPPLLRDHGLGEALRNAAGRATVPTSVRVETDRRFEAGVEAAVYFCCLEAIQNAAKHAGEGANVTVRVAADEAGLAFTVSDDGAGFDAAGGATGHGFVNMRDRVGALGGALTVHSAPGSGTTIRGDIPVPAEVDAA
ncbi:sensor histidine kinase [Phytoactinopolyspora halotolerans]|uniref:histidine kinase n=1 Tax=Phytoactinopolyspora halotolerans TaxID=1981512 RepID=A0A6L9S5Z6_9ACTN|nr:histidine kinase [Phytoactinopolyspora halotolerans]NED99931.1 GAF domain-containing protein [Phytoactinopolyspora halotolerans]